MSGCRRGCVKGLDIGRACHSGPGDSVDRVDGVAAAIDIVRCMVMVDMMMVERLLYTLLLHLLDRLLAPGLAQSTHTPPQ